MSKLGKKLIEAFKEGIEIAQGKADPSIYKIHYPKKEKKK